MKRNGSHQENAGQFVGTELTRTSLLWSLSTSNYLGRYGSFGVITSKLPRAWRPSSNAITEVQLAIDLFAISLSDALNAISFDRKVTNLTEWNQQEYTEFLNSAMMCFAKILTDSKLRHLKQPLSVADLYNHERDLLVDLKIYHAKLVVEEQFDEVVAIVVEIVRARMRKLKDLTLGVLQAILGDNRFQTDIALGMLSSCIIDVTDNVFSINTADLVKKYPQKKVDIVNRAVVACLDNSVNTVKMLSSRYT